MPPAGHMAAHGDMRDPPAPRRCPSGHALPREPSTTAGASPALGDEAPLSTPRGLHLAPLIEEHPEPPEGRSQRAEGGVWGRRHAFQTGQPPGAEGGRAAAQSPPGTLKRHFVPGGRDRSALPAGGRAVAEERRAPGWRSGARPLFASPRLLRAPPPLFFFFFFLAPPPP